MLVVAAGRTMQATDSAGVRRASEWSFQTAFSVWALSSSLSQRRIVRCQQCAAHPQQQHLLQPATFTSRPLACLSRTEAPSQSTHQIVDSGASIPQRTLLTYLWRHTSLCSPLAAGAQSSYLSSRSVRSACCD